MTWMSSIHMRFMMRRNDLECVMKDEGNEG